MQPFNVRLKEYLDEEESEIFWRMKMWAQNELEPQVRRVNLPRCETALFLLAHGFMQTFMEKTYDMRGRAATEAFLKRFVDGRKAKDRFSLIASDLHEMRNVMAHQLYSSRTHDIAFDYRLSTGWENVSGKLHVNPRIFGDRFRDAIDGGRLVNWRTYTTRLALTRQKYRFIISWLGLQKADPLRIQIESLITLTSLGSMRKPEKDIRKAFKARYGV